MKKLLLFTALFVLATLSQAQNYTYRSTSYTEPVATADEEGVSIAKDASGNMYAVGTVYNGTNNDISLSKYNALGVLQWEVFYNNGGNDTPVKVEIGESSNVYVTGNSQDGTPSKALIAKYNPSGVLQWDIHDGGVAGKTLQDSKTNSTGQTVIVGHVSASSTDINGFVVKYNSDGTYAWGAAYDNSSTDSYDDDYFEGVTINTSTNDVYIGGYNATNTGVAKMLILKYNSSGTQQWVKNTTDGLIYDILGYGLTTNFRLYCSGKKKNGSNNNSYFSQYNSSGTLQWETIGSENIVYPGGAYIAAYSSNFYVKFKSTNKILKYNTSGTKLWEASVDDAHFDNPQNHYVNANGVFVNTGGNFTILDINTGAELQILTNHDELPIYTSLGLKEHEGVFYGNSIIENNGIIYNLGIGERDGAAEQYSRIAMQSYCVPLGNVSIEDTTEYCGDYTEIEAVNAIEADWAYQLNQIYPTNNVAVNDFSETSANSVEISISSLPHSTGGTVYLYAKAIDSGTCPEYFNGITLIQHSDQFLGSYPYDGGRIDALTDLQICPGGTASAIIRNGEMYAYDSVLWYNQTTSQLISSCTNSDTLNTTQIGTHYAIVTDEYNCTDTTTTVTVTETSNPTVNLGADFSECADLSVTLNTGYTHAQYNFIWSNGASTPEISFTDAGTYSVTVTGLGCTPATDEVTITRLPNPKPNIGADFEVCLGDDFTLNANLSGIAYTWNNGSTAPSTTLNYPGTFMVTVDNGTGCSNSDTIKVSPTITGELYTSGDASVCNGNSATLNIDSALVVTDYFDFYEDFSSHNFYSFNLIEGTSCGSNKALEIDYYATYGDPVSVTLAVTPGINDFYIDLKSPYLGGSFYLEIDNVSTLFSNGVNISRCDNALRLHVTGTASYTADGSVNIRFKGPNSSYTRTIDVTELKVFCKTTPSYNWYSNPTGYTATTQSITVNPSETTQYIASFDHGGCTVRDTATVSITTVDLGADLSVCENQNFTLDAGTADSYLWSTGSTAQSITSSMSVNGLIWVEVVKNGCTVRDTINVTISPFPNVNLGAASQHICEGQSITFDAGTADSYIWSTGATTQTITVSTNGSYTVTATNTCGSRVDNVSLNVLSNPIPTIIGNSAYCEGSNVTLDVDLLAMYGYTYNWSNSATTQTTTVTAGTYTVTVTDPGGCSGTSASVTVVEHANPIPIITGDLTYCEGSNVTLDAGTYTAYNWSNSATSQTATVTAGTYSVEVEDANGCTGTSESVTVVENANPTPVITGDLAYCAGSNVTLDAGTYTSYNWSNSATSQTTTVTAGTYSVEVEDANGCTGTSVSVTVVENALATFNLTANDANCNANDGSVTLNIVSGTPSYTYLWSNGASTQNLSNIVSGNYAVTVTDGNNCDAFGTAIVNELGAPILSISSNNVNCEGGSDGSATIVISGGVSPFTIIWDDDNTQDTETASNLSEGTYNVSVSDNNGCNSYQTTTIVALHSNPTPSITGNLAYCEGSNVTLDAGTYTSYNWSNSATTQTTTVTSGTYSVEVEDANGCTGTSASVTAVEQANPTPTITGNLEYCEGSNVTLDAGTYTSYNWSNSASTQTTTVTAGTYSVEVADANGCTGTSASVTVVENENPIVSLGNDTIICNDATLTLDAGTFTNYLWNDGSSNQTLIVNALGTYSVQITDENGCVASDEIVVDVTVCSGITEKGTSFQIKVYPNPAHELLFVETGSINAQQIRLTDVSGKVIYSEAIEQNRTQIDMAHLEQGVYFVHIQFDGQTETLKIIKQ